MDIIIQSLGFKASDNLDAFVREKVGNLASHGDKIIRANVTMFKGSESDHENCFCEIRLEVPGNDLFVKKSGEDYEQAIVETVNTLQKTLGREKDKELSSRRPDTIM